MAKKKESAKPPEKMKFEEAMDELELIVGQMEEGGFSLDESIDKFERGIRLSQVCAKQLEKAELKVEKLTRTASGDLEVVPLDAGDEEDETPPSNDESDEEPPSPADEGLLF